MSGAEAEGFLASEEAFHEKAQAETGLDDFGDPAYREGLQVLLRSLDEDAHLSRLGRMIFRGQLVTGLSTRLRSEQQLKENPAALENEIVRPMFITGLVRTGSTALHYLMGQDPGTQKLEYWLAARPKPRPDRNSWEEDADFQTAAKEIKFLYDTTPSLMAVHEMRADWPEECRHLLEQSFTDDRYETAATLPQYVDWYHNTPHPEAYVRHKKLIQLIGSTDPGRRWLLKYPVHLRQLPALFDVYPDACIIQTHRDPRTVLASYTSFLTKVREMHEESVDVAALAREQMEGWANAAEAGIEARKAQKADQFFDLHFDDYMADPVGSVRRIYDHFGQELSAEGEHMLEAWRTAHPQGKHGEHKYERREIGVSEAETLDRFAGYMDHFGMKA
jgi:hypothetical protein